MQSQVQNQQIKLVPSFWLKFLTVNNQIILSIDLNLQYD